MKLYYTTFPDEETQQRITEQLVDDKLAACVVALPASSTYPWDDELRNEDEVVALFKTSESREEAFLTALDEAHPYDTPAILGIPVAANKAYDQWVHEATEGIVDQSGDADETVLIRFDTGPIFRVPRELSIHKVADRVQSSDANAGLQRIVEDIQRIAASQKTIPVLVNGREVSVHTALTSFDDEPVHIVV